MRTTRVLVTLVAAVLVSAILPTTLSQAARPGAGVEPPAPTQVRQSAPVRPLDLSAHLPVARRKGPVEDPYYPGRSNPEIDVAHEGLDLGWDGTTLTGTATVSFRATENVDAVRLDLIHALVVSSVTQDGGGSVAFAQRGYGLTVQTGPLTPGEPHTLTIDYAGVPHPVKAPTHRGDFAEGLGWSVDQEGNVSTFQEPYGAYTWYPVNDHPSDKARYDVTITVPAADTAVFNGVLTGSSSTGTTTTDTWQVSTPVASYLTTVAIGPYTAHHDTMPDGTPATFWLLPRDAGILDSLESQAADAFGWLEDHAGTYPFDQFGIVVTAGDSAMETQGLVTLSRTAFERPDAVVEHEMAHQWYGDAVTPLDWQGLWLSEGWAMWMQQAYEVYRGGYRYLGGMDNWRPYDNASRKQDGPPGDYDPKSFGALNVYLGPAMMLDKIRQRVGDAEFTTLSEQWVSQHEYGNVTRAEFLHWLDAQTGQRFNRLVNHWLDSPHTPRWP